MIRFFQNDICRFESNMPSHAVRLGGVISRFVRTADIPAASMSPPVGRRRLCLLRAP